MAGEDRRPVRLILCDIDRTILPNGDTSVSPRTRAAFLAAREAGTACGVAPDGALRVRTAQGIIDIRSSAVSVRPAATDTPA